MTVGFNALGDELAAGASLRRVAAGRGSSIRSGYVP